MTGEDGMARLIRVLSDGEPMTAAALRALLGRPVDKDLTVLAAAGWPVECDEAGAWAIVRTRYLPETAMSEAEISMLNLASGLLTDIDPAVAQFLGRLAGKVETDFPEDAEPPDLTFADLEFADIAAAEWVGPARRAIRLRLRLTISYADRKGKSSLRSVRPLLLDDITGSWSLIGWCELRRDFHEFRLDRMTAVKTGTPFPREEGREIEDYMDNADQR